MHDAQLAGYVNLSTGDILIGGGAFYKTVGGGGVKNR